MADLLLVIKFYAVLQLLGLAAWPWLALLLRLRQGEYDGKTNPADHPPDLAFPLAKSLGLILVAYGTWLASFGLAPFAGLTAWLVWAIIGAVGWALLSKQARQVFGLVKSRRRSLLAGEVVFLIVFLYLCRVRALTPDATFTYDVGRRTYDASGSEKFTNLALLTGLHRERRLPPRDTWLAGETVNYYYFGQFEWATVFKMAGVSPRVGFNLGQAALFALIAANAFSLVLLLTRRLGAGVVAAYAAPLMGSPYGFIQLLVSGVDRYNYWQASRIVEGTIQADGTVAGPITELPFFTFIVGDFHAHGISFHSYLLALAIAFLFPVRPSVQKDNATGGVAKRVDVAAPLGLLLLGLLVAVTAMTNTWDAPSVGLLVAVILLIRYLLARGIKIAAVAWPVLLSAIVAALALVFLMPHLAAFSLPVGAIRDPGAFYIGPVKWLGLTHLSEFKDYMVHFGFLLVPMVGVIHARLVGHARRAAGKGRPQWANLLWLTYLASLLVFLFAQRYFLLFFLAAMIGYAVVLALIEILRGGRGNKPADERNRLATVAICGLSAVGLYLSLFAELWVVDDGYEGAFERYNTVFKLYNVTWLLYAVGFAASLAVLLPPLRNGPRDLARFRFAWPRAAAAAILLMGFAYPFAATNARLNEYQRRARAGQRVALPPGSEFDAVRYYASVDRDEYALVEWIERNIEGKPVVAEACRTDDAYTVQSRIATFTGVRTVVAWPKHEANWRSHVPPKGKNDKPTPIWTEMGRRMKLLEVLYTSTDPNIIRAIVEQYKIDYIMIGRWERHHYGPTAGQALRKIYKPAFEKRDTVLLKTQ